MGQHALPQGFGGSRRVWGSAAAVAVALTAAFGAVLAAHPVAEDTLTALDDLGQLGAALLGGGGAAYAAVRAFRAAYPLGDVLLASLVVLLLARAEPGNRTALLLLGGGVLALAVADSAFMYGTSTGSYASGALLDAGWFSGFLAIAVAGLATKAIPAPQSMNRPVPGWLRLLLPYVPTAFATVDVF